MVGDMEIEIIEVEEDVKIQEKQGEDGNKWKYQ